MEQECKIAIIGGGPAGCTCAYFLQNSFQTVIFDFQPILSSILKTGGGKCNLSYNEFDTRLLAQNYPRGEKFLYSIFAKFSVNDTLELFKDIGVDTYVRDDNKIFPTSNSAKDLREKFLKKLDKTKFVKEKVISIKKADKNFIIITQNNKYTFDKIIYSTGTRFGLKMLEDLNIPTVPLRPSLVGYITKEKFSDLSGITIKNVKSNDLGIEGDILFTHKGISGPLIYKISSLKARENFPFVLEFDLISRLNEFQKLLEKNSHKLLKNLLSEFLPKSFCQYFVENKGIEKLVCSQVTKNIREDILTSLHKFKVNVIETNPDGETVRAGGVDLNSLNPKTLESKSIEGLYFCGEILNIDGFCGGFNLQNCWSSAFVVQEAIHQTFNLNTPNI